MSMDYNEAMLSALRRPEPMLDFQYQSVLGGMDFKRLQLTDVVLSLLIDTASFRERAMSYRKFNVGAGARGIGPGGVGRILGFNVKLDETDGVNIHAEDLVTAKAHDMGLGAIAVLAVIGETQPDSGSGEITHTLHPCGRCRGRLRDNALLTDETLIVCATPDFKAIELTNLVGLELAHDTKDRSGITTFLYDETPQVFGPLPQPGPNGYIRLNELPEIDDSDWQSTVGTFLMNRYFRTIIGS